MVPHLPWRNARHLEKREIFGLRLANKEASRALGLLASLLEARMLLGAPGRTTRSKDATDQTPLRLAT